MSWYHYLNIECLGFIFVAAILFKQHKLLTIILAVLSAGVWVGGSILLYMTTKLQLSGTKGDNTDYISEYIHINDVTRPVILVLTVFCWAILLYLVYSLNKRVGAQ